MILAPIRFTVPGEPIPKERPRFARTKKGVRTYTTGRTMGAEQIVKLSALAKGVRPKSFPACMTCRFYVSNLKHGDIDNLTKLVADALNGVAWDDDKQVLRHGEGHGIYLDATNPRTEIAIEWMSRTDADPMVQRAWKLADKKARAA